MTLMPVNSVEPEPVPVNDHAKNGNHGCNVRCGAGTVEMDGECVGRFATCAGLWDGVDAGTSATGLSQPHYRPADPCQCNGLCVKYGNCCSDAPILLSQKDEPTAVANFCHSKGCPDYYEPSWQCQCNSRCTEFGNCCSDARCQL